jgi:hypothetical protein
MNLSAMPTASEPEQLTCPGTAIGTLPAEHANDMGRILHHRQALATAKTRVWVLKRLVKSTAVLVLNRTENVAREKTVLLKAI